MNYLQSSHSPQVWLLVAFRQIEKLQSAAALLLSRSYRHSNFAFVQNQTSRWFTTKPTGLFKSLGSCQGSQKIPQITNSYLNWTVQCILLPATILTRYFGGRITGSEPSTIHSVKFIGFLCCTLLHGNASYTPFFLHGYMLQMRR